MSPKKANGGITINQAVLRPLPGEKAFLSGYPFFAPRTAFAFQPVQPDREYDGATRILPYITVAGAGVKIGATIFPFVVRRTRILPANLMAASGSRRALPKKNSKFMM
ncbi:MAG: hypothetical protein FWD77_12130 [Betaproteobacteria bacterium]|nr:hypothetical protein [Betaproteobacteria bacterium]